VSQRQRETGRRVLQELAALLHARGVEAVYHQPPERRPGYGWIAINPAGRRAGDDAVWYVMAGAQRNGRRLDRPHLVWGRRFEHQAPADDLHAAADQIATTAPRRPTRHTANGRAAGAGRPAARTRRNPR
jgi:sugar phosphate isomerase/epimerase